MAPVVDAAIGRKAGQLPELPQKMSPLALYSRFAFAGAVCCSVTHGAFTPVDVYVHSLQSARRHKIKLATSKHISR